MNISRLTLAASLALSISCTAIADETVSVKAAYISLDPSGEIAANFAGTPGTRVDVDSTLGLDQSDSYTVEAALQLGDFRLGAAYLPLNFEGVGSTPPITFNGQTFTGTVTSKLDADIFDVSLTYFLFNMDDLPTRVQLGIEGAIKITRAESSLSTSLLTEATSGTVPIPTLGMRARVGLADFAAINGRVGYLGYAGNRFLDAEASVEFSPLPAVGAYAGYRYIEIKVDESDVFLDTRFSGAFAGAFVRF
ncbi:MAG: hypothetical protein R8K46_02515 [Mariprofundaceae bacterium]